jgi:hypothetical protein
MPIWKLTPTNLSDPAWGASKHCGDAIVRAASEGAARRISACAFQTTPDGARSPWADASLVSAEEAPGLGYDPQGRSEVLAPPA